MRYIKPLILLLLLNPPILLADSKVSLGLIVSLSGPAGEQGRNWLNGAELARDELKKENIEITLNVEDDLTQPVAVARAFQRLVTTNKVQAVIGGTWDFLAETAYPLAVRYKIPFLTPTNPAEVVAKNNPYIFTNGLSLAACEEAAKNLFNSNSFSSIGLVYPQLPFGRLNADLIKKIAVSRNIPVVVDEQFAIDGNLGDALRQSALKVVQKKPELVFIVTDYNGVDLLMREFKRYRFSPTILTTQHLDRAFELTKDFEMYSKAYGIYPAISDSGFDARYKQKFGSLPKVYSAHGYDAVKFLAYALSKKVDLIKRDTDFSYQGVTGEHRLKAGSPALTEPKAVLLTVKDF